MCTSCVYFVTLGVQLLTGQNFAFSRLTGEPSQFEFPIPASGTLSGFEKFFWTTSSDCLTVVTGSVLAGTFSIVGDKVATSTVSLLNVLPTVYYMCYDDTEEVNAPYNRYNSVVLTVRGKLLPVEILFLWSSCVIIDIELLLLLGFFIVFMF